MPVYPKLSAFHMQLWEELHPLFKTLKDGISEFTFANLYLFRETHKYEISRLEKNLFVVAGSDKGNSFFMLPFGIPDKDILDELFNKFVSMKCVPEKQAQELVRRGYLVKEDRGNLIISIQGKKCQTCLAENSIKRKTLSMPLSAVTLMRESPF